MDMSNMKSDKTRRLAIYVTYDKDGIIDDYIVFCILALKKLNASVVIVSNHVLSDKMREKAGCADYVFEREDTGFDAGGIADALNNLIGWEVVKKFDELIFMNDSVFGPFFDIQEMFDEMDQRRELDFWGITRRAESDFDGGTMIYPDHIQLYFYVVRTRMLVSREFRHYWMNIPDRITDFRSAITNYEFEFTKHFELCGYQWGVYIQDNEFETPNPELNLSPYHYDMDRLTSQWKCPFIKRKLFTGDFIFPEHSDRSGVKAAFDWIRLFTSYDVNMIWSHILRIYYLQDIISGLQMYEFLPVITHKKCVFDIPEKENRVYYWDSQGTYTGSHYEPEGFALIINYEHLNFHKKNNVPYPLIKARRRLIEENLFPGTQETSHIINMFKKEERLGVIVPPPYTYGKITDELTNKWVSKHEAEEIYKKMELTVPFDRTCAPVYAVEALWCRAGILQKNTDGFIRGNQYQTFMQMMPLMAQEKGFYTKVLISSSYLSTYMENMSTIVRNLLSGISASDLSLKETEDELKRSALNQFCEKYADIYIYGAGEKAVRIYHLIENKSIVRGFIVTGCEGNPERIEGLGVIPAGMLKAEKDAGIISAVGIRNRTQIQKTLSSKNIKNIYWA